ncbi:M50 family metallopeptidase [Pararhodobacter zhoushanensis]|uniref:M50 family metallopeptidase n=1 Tax=Pararhodobacter zhoushanensis TaxID=2479545 RepID=A0ABT3GXL8_9RHOB|nr:M50 family metallopeptidase [Pararhodobacter zhoushanensis]MCW1932304.1 M50 family metallopeptidase [Pararhodobacter zhoushanensis]
MTPLASFAEFRRRQLPPATHWSPYIPIWVQVAAAIAVGVVAVSLLVVTVPNAFYEARTATVTLVHEIGHASISWLDTREFGQIDLHEHGGVAFVSSSGDVWLAIAAAAGILLPAWMAAAILALGLTRVGIEFGLLVSGVIILVVALLHADISPDSFVAISVLAGGMLLAGGLPMGGALRSGLCLAIAGALSLAVYEGRAYAYVDYIDSDPSHPADARIVANALDIVTVDEVGDVLTGLMVVGYVAAILISWAWLSRIGAIRRIGVRGGR